MSVNVFLSCNAPLCPLCSLAMCTGQYVSASASQQEISGHKDTNLYLQACARASGRLFLCICACMYVSLNKALTRYSA